MRIPLLLLLVLFAACVGAAQQTYPVATMTGKASVTYDEQDLEWLQFGGVISVSILVDKNGKPKVADITGPMAPCSALTDKHIEHLRKTVTDMLLSVTYEPAKDKDGKPVESGLKLSVKVPARKPGAVVTANVPDPLRPDSIPVQTISAGVVNGKAISLPKPPYPSEAHSERAGGVVNVQVLIDESGKVITAGALQGHPALRHVSEETACKAKFTPTTLQGQAVKVSGVVTFNFIP